MVSTKERITVEDMCRYLKIESVESWEERNLDYCFCQVKGEEAWDPYTCTYIIADDDHTCETCSFNYRGKVIAFFSKVLEKFGLELNGDQSFEDSQKLSLESYLTWTIVAKHGWYYSAKELIEVINGCGIFEFRNVTEAIDSGPYEGTRGFVTNHLGWVSEWYNLYEGTKTSHMFERWAMSV